MNRTVKHLKTASVLLLALVMLLSLAACGKEEAPAAEAPALPAATEAPAVQTEVPAEEPGEEPVVNPAADAVVLEGVFFSASKNFCFGYEPAYLAVANPAGNAMIYPTGEVGLPYCSVSLISGSNGAVAYLQELAAAASEELGDTIKTMSDEPADAGVEGRQIYSITFSYDSFEAEGILVCAYYAEDLPGGDIVVYNSTTPEGDTAVTDGILNTAIATFSKT